MTIRFETPVTVRVPDVLALQKHYTRINHVDTSNAAHCFTLNALFAKDIFITGVEVGRLIATVHFKNQTNAHI